MEFSKGIEKLTEINEDNKRYSQRIKQEHYKTKPVSQKAEVLSVESVRAMSPMKMIRVDTESQIKIAESPTKFTEGIRLDTIDSVEESLFRHMEARERLMEETT